MGFKIVQKLKTVLVTDDGHEFVISDRPEGTGTIREYHKELVEFRKQYGYLLEKLSVDGFIAEKRLEAEREWRL